MTPPRLFDGPTNWLLGILTTGFLVAALLLLVGCGGSTSPQPTAKTPTKAGQLHQPGPPVVTVPTHVVPVPASAGKEGKADGRVLAGSASCGRERWNVKTATDPAAAQINIVPQDSTIEVLGQLPTSNSGNPDQPRDSGAESQVYRITATLDAAKVEADSDIHLALSDGKGHTMIAEIPKAPACTEPPVTAKVSVLETQIEQARNAFVQEFGEPSSSGFTTIGHQVTITGIGFFDKLHGQRNVAPNGIEIHPVLSITDP